MLASRASHEELAIPARRDRYATSHTQHTRGSNRCTGVHTSIDVESMGGGTVARAWSRTRGACNGSGFSQAGWSCDERKAGCRTSLAAPTPLARDEQARRSDAKPW